MRMLIFDKLSFMSSCSTSHGIGKIRDPIFVRLQVAAVTYSYFSVNLANFLKFSLLEHISTCLNLEWLDYEIHILAEEKVLSVKFSVQVTLKRFWSSSVAEKDLNLV